MTSLLNRVVTAVYSCRDNVFVRGTYLFDRTDYGDATALYASMKANVAKSLGEPTHDAASQKYRDRLRELGLPQRDQDSYVAIWEKQKMRVHLSLSGPAGGEGWTVGVSYEPYSGSDTTTR